jgi:hypothetical protein
MHFSTLANRNFFGSEFPTLIYQLCGEFLDLTKMVTSPNAFIHTGRLFPSIDPVITEMAIFSRSLF